jgi:hypothetical protein
MPEVINPIAPPAPTFEIPEGMQIAASVVEFARAPIGLDARQPTDAEQVARLSQARDILGEKFYEPSAPIPTVAETRERDRQEMLGIRVGAQPHEYVVQLPEGVPDTASERIRGTMAALELAGPVGNHIAASVIRVGQHVSRLSETEQTEWHIEQQRMVVEWAARHGWGDIESKKADVVKLLADRKADAAVVTIALADADTFIRLVNHADHLKTIKR